VIAISLQDDKSTENWLLWYGESGGEVWYWPSKLFTNLKDSADVLRRGGMVYSSTQKVPQM
jgi:hypothetical protein